MAISKKQREILREKFGGKCAYCGEELPAKGWHADHANPVMRIPEVDEAARLEGKFKLKYSGRMHCPENDTLENMMPACSYCNINKSSLDIEGFRKYIATRVNMVMKTTAGKMASKYNQLTIHPTEIVFHFEKFKGDKNNE